MSEMIQVPDWWEVLSLEKLISKVIDFRGKTPLKIGMDWGNGLIPSLSANNVQMGKVDFSKETHFGSEELYNVWMNKGATQKDDILFTMEAPLGNVALIPDDNKYILSQRVILLRTGKKIISHYMYYQMMSDDFQTRIFKYSSGSTVKGIQYSQLKKILIAFPKKVSEQEKIAKILSTLDKAIESTNHLIEKEKNIKTALMQKLLTNGIDKNGQIRTKATHTYKPSKLGLIPDEWEVVSLEKIGNVITGNTPPTDNEEYYNGNIPFIGPVDFVGQKYIIKSEKTVSKDGLNYSREIPKDSILTVCIGSTIGKIALAIKQCCTNQQINALVCNKKYFSEFVFYAMGQFLQRQLDAEAGLQAVPIVNKSSFAKLVLPCPLDIEEQKQIAKILTVQDKKIRTEETNLAKLKELKKGLMNDLLSGNVRVII